MGDWVMAMVAGVAASPWMTRVIARYRLPPPVGITAVACGFAGLAAILTAGLHQDPVARVALPPLALLAVALIQVDRVQKILPDTMLRLGYTVLAITLIAGAAVTAASDQLLRAAAAAALCFTGYALLAARGGLGFGDVKLGGLLGMACGWIGWGTTVYAVIFAFAIGAIVGARARFTRADATTFAFGPSMFYGALTSLALT